jgi:hypothetical protein
VTPGEPPRVDPLRTDHLAAPATDDGSWGILLFAGGVVLVVTTCLDAALVPGTGWRLALLAAAVAVIAERTADPRAALGCAALAFALGDGFLQHSDGVLGLDAVDFPFALGLLGATALGMCAGQVRMARQRARNVADPVVPTGSLGTTERVVTVTR